MCASLASVAASWPTIRDVNRSRLGIDGFVSKARALVSCQNGRALLHQFGDQRVRARPPRRPDDFPLRRSSRCRTTCSRTTLRAACGRSASALISAGALPGPTPIAGVPDRYAAWTMACPPVASSSPTRRWLIRAAVVSRLCVAEPLHEVGGRASVAQAPAGSSRRPVARRRVRADWG